MKTKSVQSVMMFGLLGIFLSCGNNNNQSEGAADDDATTTGTPAVAPGSTATDTSTTGTANDTVIRAQNADPGEGSNISGTGVNNGSGKTGGG